MTEPEAASDTRRNPSTGIVRSLLPTEKSGTADLIRAEDGNLRYEYYIPMNDPETAEGLYRMTITRSGRSVSFSSVRYQERLWSKNALKRVLYRVLCRENGRTLPWGTLTGIRPAKLALTELMEEE